MFFITRYKLKIVVSILKSRIAKLALCLPHSNADEERVFSHVLSEAVLTSSHNLWLDLKLNIGLVTRSTLYRLVNGDDVSTYQVQKFYKGVLGFFVSALDF